MPVVFELGNLRPFGDTSSPGAVFVLDRVSGGWSVPLDDVPLELGVSGANVPHYCPSPIIARTPKTR